MEYDLAILIFLLHLAAATMLLLFGVRMVRTGIERAMGSSFKRLVTGTKRNNIQGAFAGKRLGRLRRDGLRHGAHPPRGGRGYARGS